MLNDDDLAEARDAMHKSAIGLDKVSGLICDEVARLRALINRSGWDQSPCQGCGEDVLCIEDGLAPLCVYCAASGRYN